MGSVNKELVELTKRFIAVPGYSELVEKETKMAETLYKELRSMGLPAQLLDYDGRYNVVCEYEGEQIGPTVVLCTHLDTVPPYEMQNPFEGKVENGRLYGRGAVDVRGILAAMSLVMKRLFEEKAEICGKVRFLAVSDEESGSYGMRKEIENGYYADLTIVGEPTELQLGIAHKGVTWIQVDFRGKTAHGSVPEEGHNAIYDANHFIQYIVEDLIPKLKDRKQHKLLGTASINVGLIDGGTRPTIVPEFCRVQIDRRLVPDEDIVQVLNEITEEAGKVNDGKADFEIKAILGDEEHPFPPLDSGRYQSILNCLSQTVSKITGSQKNIIGLPYWTDAALPGYYTGKAAVVIGPGNIAQAHSNNEYIDISQLEQSVEVYDSMVRAISELYRKEGENAFK